MYTATAVITITEFVPMNGVYGNSPSICANIAPPTNTSPPPFPDIPVFSGDGESIQVNIPAGYTGAVQITYQLPDPAYVLLGLAFRSPGGGLGRSEFRTISVNRDPSGSQLTVTDACNPTVDQVDFNYVILVQEAATGNIGLIDPDIETDITEA